MQNTVIWISHLLVKKFKKNGIKGLKGGKSGGPDLILNEFIKVGSNTLALTMIKLFNKILNLGRFPKIWNISLLTSIYKSGDPTDCGNYRGISISSCLGKLFTSLLQKRISDFLETNGLLSDNIINTWHTWKIIQHNS